MLTASADTKVKLWDVGTGSELASIEHQQPARSVAFATGSRLAAVTTDAFMGSPASLRVYRVAEEGNEEGQSQEAALKVDAGNARLTRARFGPLNKEIVTCDEAGSITTLDAETGQQKERVEEAHKKGITDMQFSQDMTHFITSSGDKTAKIWETGTLRHLKTFQSDRPLNAAAISPLMDHVVVGGGQDVMSVTTTSSKAGKFEAKLYHKIFEEDLGSFKGHFGPINCVAFSPDGRSFTTGGEDGFARVNFFDAEVYKLTLMEGIDDRSNSSK